MAKTSIRKLKQNKGQLLIFGYMVLVSLLILVAPLLNKILSEGLLVERQRRQTEAFYLAEGGLEDAINRFLSGIANFQIDQNIPRYPASGFITTTYTCPTAPLYIKGATVSSFITQAESGERTIADSDGTQVKVKTYIVTATCAHPLYSGISVTVNQSITRRLVYTFQHAVFYNDDLEILPGVNMTFTGRIHSNKDMYLGSHAILKVDSEYLHSAGNIYNKRKDSTDAMNGDVRIKKAGTGSYNDMDGLDSNSSNWLTESQDRWKGTVKSSVHGVTGLSTPAVASIQPDGHYANNANIRIENGTIRQGSQILVEGTDIPAGTIVTDTDFYNNREGKYVRMTNIDLKKLAGYAPGDPEGSPNFPSHLPSNGLLYATRQDASSSEEPGIRLVNGTQIYRSGGLTVVSNDPVYIQGDYNTVNKKPSAVFCDSVNLLSNSWDDANSHGGLSGRVPTPTIVNTAFIAGVNNTTVGNYNGGLENYPRLHEDWGGKELRIRGAFIELWNNQIAQGAWVYGGSQYTAPTRNWDYDSDFTASNMPPFTPWAVEAQRGAWW